MCYQLPDEENADTGVVLGAFQTKVVFKIVQSCLCDGIAVEVVLGTVSACC